MIRGFTRALIRDSHLADDVLQETFLTIGRKAASFEKGTNFPKWACAIARLKVLEARRREAGRVQFLSSDAIEALASTDEPVERDIRLDVVEECIEALPPSMRKMIDLRYVVEQKPTKIASIIGWSVEAVYVGLSRARSSIRDCIDTKLKGLEESA